MKLNFKIDSGIKIAAICVLSAGTLASCGGKDKPASATSSGATSYEVAGDHVLGSADAPITVVEYASVTCGHCATWSNTVWPEFRKQFVDTGKVRYVFREFPTQPQDLAMAGHLIANCAAEDKFFDIIHLQFKRQREILTSSDVKGEYVRLAKSAGLDEEAFGACMANEVEIERLMAVVDGGVNAGITGTPTFIINGKVYDTTEVYDIDSFKVVFSGITGEPLPEATKPADDGHGHADGEDHSDDEGH